MTQIAAENIEVLEDLVGVARLELLFHRSGQTIDLWRKQEGLPYVLIPGGDRAVVRFREERVLEWARANGKRIYPTKENAR